MHVYKWPINCTRTRMAGMGTPPQRTLSRSLLEELLSAEVDEVLQEHDRPTPSKPSSSNSGESKMEAEEERAGDTGAFPYNP